MGDDELWAQEDILVAPAEAHEPIRFWRGLLLGLALSGAGWLLVALAGLALYKALVA
ncbi:MAG: hypothetical protein ACRDNB_12890 [Gaiellaceae bacterium]